MLEECRSSYRNEHFELSKLRIEKVNLESIVKQIKNNDEGYLKVKDIVKRAVEDIFTNYRYLLNLAFQSVIDSCRSDPSKFNILYYNLPADTMETPLTLSNWSNQYNYGLSADEKLSYRYSNVYARFLLDEAEQFFNKRVKELTQVCISRLAELCISESTSPQLTTKSYLE